MGNLSEIKQRLGRLAELSSRMRGLLTGLRGPEGLALRAKAKEQGKRVGVGAGITTFGVLVMVGAALYINALLIILLDLAMPLWAAALIVVLGMLLVGAAVAMAGVGIIRKAIKNFPSLGGDAMQSLKEAGDEMKETVEELQTIAKEEAGERQNQLKNVVETIKPMAPYIIGAYIGYRIIKKVVRSRKTRRVVLEELQD